MKDIRLPPPPIMIYQDAEVGDPVYRNKFVIYQKNEGSIALMEVEYSEIRREPYSRGIILGRKLREFSTEGKGYIVDQIVESMIRRCRKQGKNLIETDNIYSAEQIAYKHLENLKGKKPDFIMPFRVI